MPSSESQREVSPESHKTITNKESVLNRLLWTCCGSPPGLSTEEVGRWSISWSFPEGAYLPTVEAAADGQAFKLAHIWGLTAIPPLKSTEPGDQVGWQAPSLHSPSGPFQVTGVAWPLRLGGLCPCGPGDTTTWMWEGS